jgi:protein SCO1/2
MYRWSVRNSRLGALLFAALLLGALSACSREATHEFAGAVLDSPELLPDFTLTAADGPVSLSDFRGEYVFLYFGYMFCPDFCPTTMSKLANVHRDLGDDAERMQVIMISVDPERDTPDALAKYAAAFNPTFLGITGTKEEIDLVGEPYGLFYERHEGSAATGYLVDHSTRTYLIGPDGRALVAYPHDATAEAILADLRWLMDQDG